MPNNVKGAKMNNSAMHAMLRRLLLLGLLASPLIFPPLVRPQLTLGQYHEEAPLRTWNTLGFTTASGLALGNTQLAFVLDSSAGMANPALIVRLPQFSLTLSSSFTAASLFKYSLVNTGVLTTSKNPTLGLYALDFFGAAINIKGWALAVNVALSEYYDRPKVEATYAPGGRLYYSLNFSQDGFLRTVNLSLAKKLHRRVSIGLGLNFITGEAQKNVQERWVTSEITITDDKSHDFTGFFVNGGLTVDLTDRFTAGIMFQTPYEKKAESKSLLRYASPQGNTDIRIQTAASNTYSQPWVAGLGFEYRWNETLRLAADVLFFNWSDYKIFYYKEDIVRDFKDVFRVGAGIEYLSQTRLFGQDIGIPLRAGFSYDPQPVRDPDTYYFYFSFGTGLRWKALYLDIGAYLGKEHGSGDDLNARRVALTLGFQI